jgi:hypothetical protein
VDFGGMFALGALVFMVSQRRLNEAIRASLQRIVKYFSKEWVQAVA